MPNTIATRPTSPRGMMVSLQAAGIPYGKALVKVIEVLGADDAVSVYLRFLAGGRGGKAVVALLDEVAETFPYVANAWLCEGLASRQLAEWQEGGRKGLHLDRRGWIMSLPDGVEIVGDLWLYGCMFLERLPAGLKVGGTLHLRNCVRLKALPAGLRVGNDLVLQGCKLLEHLPARLEAGVVRMEEGCAAWDGRIPADAKIQSLVFTKHHPRGIRLIDWRRKHPGGEAAT